MKVVNTALALAAATLGGGAAISELIMVPNPALLAQEIVSGADHTTAIELAESIVRGDRNLLIFDLRARAEFEGFHIPGAQWASVLEVASGNLPRTSTVVLYSEGGAHAAQAWMLLRLRGYRRVAFLREGIYEWMSRVIEPRLAVDATTSERVAFQHAAELSRFFGGTARSDVPRREVPQGYWTGLPQDGNSSADHKARNLTRRRGC